ncbi:phosphate ABC transporter permease subunit PstC [Bacillus pseudomycoides]|uniref:Phosphate transport system permease protein n=1 Tax=Bacillus pseudomycoides TaxID=64104 RepID=A0AA91ZUK3_9BACI|nr:MULTISPECIES: phosphate ABC transporter permease subunit PstC [Bacillus]PEB53362.1 phosphate ABC transporter permease subunit PstC [Bacillus sp. AFS098217]PED83769.1 phosphate ABC transporter permease subunit PstC [Bacillus pseudomycoides]PEU14761.1 phosphate ABC transporter permease subunit PstC [Bacillus sp. AFS019443]PEU19487.1 phosphate ABC transporter permease subunit PstC [Bacillus sp. AFS014408]PFW64432.1 phosphate ABC transporter permease subunit PstC [Bacillus sp. AFS075034]
MARNDKSQITFSVQHLIERNTIKRKKTQRINRMVPLLLKAIASVSILTTIGIIITLANETMMFFQKVSFYSFFTEKEWLPFFEEPKFGILPLICGTVLVTSIAMVVAIPIGLGCAIFLNEYASNLARKVLKPLLELLAGIPTIVYGFFALTIVTPFLQRMIPDLQFFNAISPGIVVGFMMIPTIASLSEDAMGAVASAVKEASMALGATRLETVKQVIFPAAFTGIMAAILLAASRAIGETMIVVIAGGSTPNISLDPTHSTQTLTAYIVQVSLGDAPHGTITYYSMYAVGATLLVFTFIMNMISQQIMRRFRKVI